MLGIKQQSQRRNDPMSILNHLKKLKSKGKIRTPRPTLEVKSSRVQSTTTVLIKKDAHTISSLQKQRDDSKTNKNKIHSQKFISQQKYIGKSIQKIDYQNKFKPLIELFYPYKVKNIDQSIKCIDDKFNNYNIYQYDKKQKNIYDQLDLWLDKLFQTLKNLISNCINTIIHQNIQKNNNVTNLIKKIIQQHQQQMNNTIEKYNKNKQKYINIINQMKIKNIFMMTTINGFSQQHLNVQKWVKTNIFGLKQQQQSQSTPSINSQSSKTQIKYNNNNKIQQQLLPNKLPVEKYRKQYIFQNQIDNFHSQNKNLQKNLKKQNLSNLQNFHAVKKHKYHNSDLIKNQMIHIQDSEDQQLQIQQSWDKFY